jgi:hypothetical protein
MLADKGEKVDAIAAAMIIQRFWALVNIEYGFRDTG